MPNTVPEIAYLLREVERKYGREVHTSTDFESLSMVIEREVGEFISASTLKRLWGYVSSKPRPRVATLDVMCRFIGYPSFRRLREALREHPNVGVGFFSAECIMSADLSEGDCLRIGWAPNCQIEIKYGGG